MADLKPCLSWTETGFVGVAPAVKASICLENALKGVEGEEAGSAFYWGIFCSSFLAPEVVKLMYRITVGVVWVELVQPAHLNPLHWYTLWAAMVFWVVAGDNWYWLYQWLVHYCNKVVHFGF